MIAPSKENVCAIIVTYNPDEDFWKRVAIILAQVDRVIIIDNNSSKDLLEICQGRLLPDCFLIRNADNVGVARALNQGFQWAMERGYAWGITFDQDTLASESLLSTFIEIYWQVENKDKIGIIGANYLDPLGRITEKSSLDQNSIYSEVNSVITSGSLMPSAVYKVVGAFRDDYFIDFVDIEYCLRARSKGLNIFISREPLITHKIGNSTPHTMLKLKSTGTSNHPEIRRYYMARNLVAMSREYIFKYPAVIMRILYKQLKTIILMLLFEDNRANKMRFIMRGIIHGLKNNLGRILQ